MSAANHYGASGRLRDPPAKRQAKKEVNSYVAALVGGLVGVMIIATFFRERGPRGPCSYAHAYRRITCRTKDLTVIPQDLNEIALSMHFGTPADKNSNAFNTIAADNFTRYAQLQELVLIKCGIENIVDAAFGQLHSLRKLDLRYNKIQLLTASIFSGLVSLEYLALSNNPIHTIANAAFRNIRIDQLVLGNNPTLSELSEGVFDGSVIRSLILSKCNLSFIEARTLQPLSPSLQEFYWTHNLQPLTLSDELFEGIKLEVLSLTDNGISDVKFLRHVTTDELQLDGNILPNIEFHTYSNLHKLKVLSIKRVGLQNLQQNTFDIFDDLRELAIDENQLDVLDVELFTDLEDLKILSLSNNLISRFTGNFSKDLRNVRSLHLDRNRIQSIPAEMKVVFSHIPNVTIGQNPLHCNCEIRWFRTWLENNRHRIADLDSLECATPMQAKFVDTPEHDLKCRPPLVVNATLDEDGMRILCLAEGDPAPDVTWLDPVGKQTKTEGGTLVQGQTTHRMTLIKEGNYTCYAENVVGVDEITVNSRDIKRFARMFGYPTKIKFLETPKGFCFTAFLVGVLFYIFKHQ